MINLCSVGGLVEWLGVELWNLGTTVECAQEVET
jgi:hypothetical protein